MRLSAALATAAFFGLVPGGLGIAYLGYRQGLYPYAALPLVFGTILVVSLIGLFAVLPWLHERERY